MKLDLPLNNQINRIFLFATIVAIFANLLICILIMSNASNAELIKTKDRLLSTSENQADKLIPLMLVSELYGSLEDELNSIKNKEGLTDIYINKKSKCDAASCYSLVKNIMSVEYRVSQAESQLGYLTKTKEIETKVLSLDSLLLILSVSVTFILTISILLIIINKFIKDHLSEPINNIDKLFKPIIENRSTKEVTPDYKIKEINNLVRNLKRVFDILQNEKKEAVFAKSFRKVSHDLRSPIMALKISMENLSSGDESKKQLMQQAMDRIEGIAKYTLDTSKFYAPDTRNVLNIDQLLKLKRVEHYSKRVLFYTDDNAEEISIADNLVLVEIESVLSNLINNSVEASASVIAITLKRQASGLIIEVTDNGHGIEQAQLSLVGTKGYTIKNDGNGIALHNASSFLKQIDGFLDIESTQNIGTKITIFLPKKIFLTNGVATNHDVSLIL